MLGPQEKRSKLKYMSKIILCFWKSFIGLANVFGTWNKIRYSGVNPFFFRHNDIFIFYVLSPNLTYLINPLLYMIFKANGLIPIIKISQEKVLKLYFLVMKMFMKLKKVMIYLLWMAGFSKKAPRHLHGQKNLKMVGFGIGCKK